MPTLCGVSPPSLKKFSPSFICFLLIGKVCNGVIRVPQDAADHSADNLLRAICCAENTKNRCKMQTWGDVSAQMYCIDKLKYVHSKQRRMIRWIISGAASCCVQRTKKCKSGRMCLPHLSFFSYFTRVDVVLDPAPLGCLSYLCCTRLATSFSWLP